jgi:hypothetical protein
MEAASRTAESQRWTRGAALRALAGAGAVVAAGAAAGARGGGSSLLAAPSEDTDAEILNVFLLLEHVHEDFYRQALEGKRLGGDLRAFASTVAGQESAHVALLTRRLGDRAQPRPQTDFGAVLDSAEAFRETAIELEEATISAYIGQGANLQRRTVAPVATLVSVEARQVAWIRDIAGVSPAPRAADPARKADVVIAELRDRGFIG